MNHITWTARIRSAPPAGRYCKRCGVKRDFTSSGLFRVNARQKSLDVWLVYKCAACDATWNLPVLSRVHPRSIPPERLRGFHENDPGLAMEYALDTALLRRCGAEPGVPEVDIIGADAAPPARITIIPEAPMTLKAEAVLRQKLGLSRKGFEEMLTGGRLVCVSRHDLRKAKLSGEIIVELRGG